MSNIIRTHKVKGIMNTPCTLTINFMEGSDVLGSKFRLRRSPGKKSPFRPIFLHLSKGLIENNSEWDTVDSLVYKWSESDWTTLSMDSMTNIKKMEFVYSKGDIFTILPTQAHKEFSYRKDDYVNEIRIY